MIDYISHNIPMISRLMDPQRQETLATFSCPSPIETSPGQRCGNALWTIGVGAESQRSVQKKQRISKPGKATFPGHTLSVGYFFFFLASSSMLNVGSLPVPRSCEGPVSTETSKAEGYSINHNWNHNCFQAVHSTISCSFTDINGRSHLLWGDRGSASGTGTLRRCPLWLNPLLGNCTPKLNWWVWGKIMENLGLNILEPSYKIGGNKKKHWCPRNCPWNQSLDKYLAGRNLEIHMKSWRYIFTKNQMGVPENGV